jgi:hypothetical protein
VRRTRNSRCAGELEAGGIQLSEGAGCRQRCRPLCGGEGVGKGEGAFVEASADDHAADADGLELPDVTGLFDAAGGNGGRLDSLDRGPIAHHR